MGKTNTMRSATHVVRIASVVPAANTNYTVDLPAGLYHLGLAVKSSITGTTTTIAIIPWVDAAQTQVNNLAVRQIEFDDTAVIPLLTLPAGAAGRLTTSVACTGTVPVGTPVLIPHGVRIALVKGTAVAGELLEIDLVVTRVA